MVTSVNRLVADLPHSVEHVEAPDPDIIMRRLATSERTMTPAMAPYDRVELCLPSDQCRADNRMPAALAPSSLSRAGPAERQAACRYCRKDRNNPVRLHRERNASTDRREYRQLCEGWFPYVASISCLFDQPGELVSTIGTACQLGWTESSRNAIAVASRPFAITIRPPGWIASQTRVPLKSWD